jgi:bifunctional non-homologous end joining protein LigD
VYSAAIEQKNGGFVVNFAFGRRGATIQTGTKTAAPVPFQEAKRIFDRLVGEKKAKGYTPGPDGVPYAGISNEVRVTGMLPQLLNPITEAEARRLLDDSAWWMQEKYDGRRVLVRKDDAGQVTGVNRKGLVIGLPEPIIACAKVLNGTFILDGEAVGDRLFAFDCLSRNGNDITARPYSTRLTMLMALVPSGAIECAPTAAGPGDKHDLFRLLMEQGKEGVVFKRHDAAYTPGRPNSGGSQLKLKFYATGSFIVAKINSGRRSVALEVLDDSGRGIYVGNVTIPANQKVPGVGTIVECRYLYCFPNGSLFQPVFLGARDDLEPGACGTSQLKYKRGEDEDA